MSAGKVRAQRAWMLVREDGDLLGPVAFVPFSDQPTPEQVTVLVIPEAAVSDCEHGPKQVCRGSDIQACTNCGSTRLLMMSGRWSKWQLPRLLRVPKERTK